MLINLTARISYPKILDWEQSIIPDSLSSNTLLAATAYTVISSGSELAVYAGNHLRGSSIYPYYPGYAAAGYVVKVANDVEGFLPGDLIYYPGTHSTYFLIKNPQNVAIKLLKESELKLAPFVRFCQIAFSAIDTVNGELKNSNVTIIGLGLLGNICGQLFKSFGAKVRGIDRHYNRRNIACLCGFDSVASSDEIEENVTLRNDFIADIVVEASGSTSAVQTALNLTRPLGQMIQLGSNREIIPIDVYSKIHRSGISVTGAHENRISFEKKREVARQAFELISNMRISLDPLISQELSYNSLDIAYDNLQNEKNKYLAITLNWLQ